VSVAGANFAGMCLPFWTIGPRSRTLVFNVFW